MATTKTSAAKQGTVADETFAEIFADSKKAADAKAGGALFVPIDKLEKLGVYNDDFFCKMLSNGVSIRLAIKVKDSQVISSIMFKYCPSLGGKLDWNVLSQEQMDEMGMFCECQINRLVDGQVLPTFLTPLVPDDYMVIFQKVGQQAYGPIKDKIIYNNHDAVKVDEDPEHGDIITFLTRAVILPRVA